MTKLDNKMSNLEKALASLELAVATPPIEDRDYGGIIQAFVSCYELLWKVLKHILETNGISAPFPRVVFEEAYKANLVEGNESWKAIMEARNLSMHTYDKTLAVDLCAIITSQYLPVMQKTVKKMRQAPRG